MFAFLDNVDRSNTEALTAIWGRSKSCSRCTRRRKRGCSTPTRSRSAPAAGTRPAPRLPARTRDRGPGAVARVRQRLHPRAAARHRVPVLRHRPYAGPGAARRTGPGGQGRFPFADRFRGRLFGWMALMSYLFFPGPHLPQLAGLLAFDAGRDGARLHGLAGQRVADPQGDRRGHVAAAGVTPVRFAGVVPGQGQGVSNAKQTPHVHGPACIIAADGVPTCSTGLGGRMVFVVRELRDWWRGRTART